MFKNFNGFHLVDAYHSMRLERRFQPGRVFKKTVEAIVVVLVTLLLWNLPSSSFGIDGLNIVQHRHLRLCHADVGVRAGARLGHERFHHRAYAVVLQRLWREVALPAGGGG